MKNLVNVELNIKLKLFYLEFKNTLEILELILKNIKTIKQK